MLLAAGEIGVSTTLRARCLTAAAAGACASFSTTRLPTCHPQKSSESDSSRSEWTPQSSRHNATTSRSGTGAFVFDMGPGNNGMPPGRAVRCARCTARGCQGSVGGQLQRTVIRARTAGEAEIASARSFAIRTHAAPARPCPPGARPAACLYPRPRARSNQGHPNAQPLSLHR